MKRTNAQAITTALLLAAWTIAYADSARIDGTSEASFERSHSALVVSLPPADQLRLQLEALYDLADADIRVREAGHARHAIDGDIQRRLAHVDPTAVMSILR